MKSKITIKWLTNQKGQKINLRTWKYTLNAYSIKPKLVI